MAIDASIPLQAQAPQPLDPLASAAKAFTLKAAAQQAQMGDMELQDNLTLREAYKGPQAKNPDGTPNYDAILAEVGGKVSPKTMTTIVTAAQHQREQHQKMMSEYVKAAGPLAAGLYTKYKQLGGTPEAWAQVEPMVKQSLAQLKQQFPGAPIKDDQITPQGLEQSAMQWDKYNEQQMRGTQPKTPHEVATEDNQKKTTDRADANQKETERHNKRMEGLAAQRLKSAQDGGAKAPVGYRWNKDKPGTLEAIPGGPATAKAKGNTIESRMQPTMLATVKLDIEEIDYGLEQIKKLKTNTAGAFFADDVHGGAFTRFMKNKLTPGEKQQYEVYANRFAMAIASIQSMGRGQVSDTKVAEAHKLVPVPGDEPATIEAKLTTIDRIKALADKTLKTPISGVAPAGNAQSGAEEGDESEVDIDDEALIDKYTKKK